MVCKRIRRRIKELELVDYKAYKDYLLAHDAEWEKLDVMCRIPISRFYRDWAVFDYLKDEGLTLLAQKSREEGRHLQIWSAGCASGEEPYTVSLIWKLVLAKEFPEIELQLIATDIEIHMLDRAKTGCYSHGSLKGLPETWLEKAFTRDGNEYCIHREYSELIQWLQQDIRLEIPEGVFDLVLCRNLVAMYFDTELQMQVFERIRRSIRPGGLLILGCHEKLPKRLDGFTAREEKLNIYAKNEAKKS